MIKEQTKKKIRRFVFSVIALFLVSAAAAGFIFVDCMQESGIGRYSPYCYLCVSSNVRNFPLIKEKTAPVFSLNMYPLEPNSTHPGYYDLVYESGASAAEITEAAETYLAARNFSVVKRNSITVKGGEGKTISFDGKDSIIEVVVRPSETGDAADNRTVHITETLKYEE